MNSFEYTNSYDSIESTLVDTVYENVNDKSVVVLLKDGNFTGNFYRYTDVDPSHLVALVEANSVGAAYTPFKQAYGPGENLGNFWDVDEFDVPVKKDFNSTPVNKEWGGIGEGTIVSANAMRDMVTNSPTKEFSLTTIPSLVVETKEYDLSVIKDADKTTYAHTVHFVLNNQDNKYKFKTEAVDVDSAIRNLNDHISAFNAAGRVTKVVVHFE
jgi:hypothetical protein